MMGYVRLKYGFTLVELAVVLVVIALVSAMGLSAGMRGSEGAKGLSTEKKLDVIEKSLQAFREKYGRLPCPADAALATSNANYGIEAASPSPDSPCTGGTPAATYLTVASIPNVPSGALPARTLGLPDEMMYDGWDRKFQYEVTPELTLYNGFLFSQVSDNCSILASGGSATKFSVSPAYALVSHGKNGIGAYLKSGAQYSTGTAGTAEQTNIRPTTNSPTVRMISGVTGAMGTSGYYDDIVRVKSRYQLMDANDRVVPVYKGPDMVVSQAAGSAMSVQLVYGKNRCGAMEEFSGTTPSSIAAVPRFIAFTPSNTNLFVYHTNSCKLYSIINTVIDAVSEGTPVPNCPAAATVGAMAKSNGMLALNSTAAPFVRVYKLIGTKASAKYMEIANALEPQLLEAPTGLSMSENGEYLAVVRKTSTTSACGAITGTWRMVGQLCTPITQNPVVAANLTDECGDTSAFSCSDAATTAEITASGWGMTGNISDDRQRINWSNSTVWERRPTATLYAKKGDQYQAISSLPGDSFAEYNSAISPSGRYYAIAVLAGGNTNIYIWRNISGTFSQLTDSTGSAILYTITGMTAPDILTFSPDSAYLAVGGTSSGDNTAVLYLNPVTEGVSVAYNGVVTTGPAWISFNKDSNMMGIARNSPDASALVLYTRTATNTFVERTISDTFEFNGAFNGNYIAFSR